MGEDALEIARRSIGFQESQRTIIANRMPTYAELNVAINKMVTERDGEWCGMPMPLPGQQLIVEDRNPHRERLAEIQRIVDEGQPTDTPARTYTPEELALVEVNRWYSHEKGGDIIVIRQSDGTTTWGLDPAAPKRNRFIFGTFDALDAWNLETETTAMERLCELLTPRMFTAYVCAGQFLETSKRSGLTYLFRRCRPTLVLSPHGSRRDYFYGHDGPREMHILCALCLHPIGYYAASFCGAMTPTDDVIAHLMLMRGDEHLFWKRANHHQAYRPESGL